MSRTECLDEISIKSTGAHYTPRALAAFLARETADAVIGGAGPVRILDPACGDGILLEAITKPEILPDVNSPKSSVCAYTQLGFN